MRLLLTTLNAKYIHTNLALHSLRAATLAMGKSIDLMEFTINNEDDLIFSELLRGDYDLICFSCYIWNIERTLALAEALKKARPEIQILFGGPEATHRAEELMRRYDWLDMILSGEGEESFPQLVQALLGEKEKLFEVQEGIPGLYFRRNDQVNPTHPAIPVDLSQLAFPYTDEELMGEKILYYESSRGCPFSCSYCLSALERGVRALPLERVWQDLDRFLTNQVKQVKFVDRTFNFDRNRAIEIFQYLIEKDNGISNFHFELCGELIDAKTLTVLEKARPGLFQLEIGVQSTDPNTLMAINRSGDFAKLSAAVGKIIEFGNIHIHLDLIAGLPLEDYNSFIRSFNHVYALRPHHLQLGFLKLLPGTPIFGEIKTYDYQYRTRPPYEVISNQFISPEDLVRLKMVETVMDLYYNRGGFRETLDFITENRGDGAFSFYEEFSGFYYNAGYQLRSHKKENLYRILREYGWRMDTQEPGYGQEVENRLIKDMNATLNSEAVRKFVFKGWALEG